MCGICGWIGGESLYPDVPGPLEAMNSALAHRGPDHAGAALFGNAGIAMSRLSIIDLASGDQPITNEDETRWIVFNGEIYNFQELGGELTARGHRFRTRSDTEVILHGYETWGKDCVQRLRGMFAFCVVESPDGQRVRRAFLARDRVGKKPLYYWHKNGRLIFGSEIKAILEHPDVSRQVNERAVPLYLTYGNVPAPDTLFQDIHELPPGHTLTFENGHISVERYWDLDLDQPHRERPKAELVEELRERLDEAVRVRLVSDVPLGAFLSGGVDSTAVVALMARHQRQPVKTLAIGFEGDE
ncbi:MAG: asparagine synthase (glutamine-hydrolyzing), partial [bacterium]|nr:asparagine synthase (glutamine-hydrolyzing) [bacterium]